MFTAANIALFLTATTTMALAYTVLRIWRTLHDFAALPSIETSRARKRFMARLEKRIREEANANPGSAFPTLLLDMISDHHIEIDALDAKHSKHMTDTLAGKKSTG